MKLLQHLFFPVQNCEETVLCLCDALNVSITRTSLLDALQEHPDYPSLFSISDVLKNYGIDNLSLRLIEPDNFIKLKTPFVAQVIGKKTHTKLFAVVDGISNEKVNWRNPETHKHENISLEEFKTLFTGYVQAYEVTEHAGEKDYAVRHKKEKAINALNNLVVFSVPLLTLIISSIALISNGINAIFPVLYTLIILAGAITGTLLILYEIDQYNPTLHKVCTAGIKTNCAAVLHSKGSKIFGIHWSVIGVSYFIGVLSVLLATGISNTPLLTTAAWLNVLVVPYTLYSVFYQAKVIQKWCPMCLAVQIELVLLLVISISGGLLSTKQLSFISFIPFVVSISMVFLAVYLLLPAMKKVKAAEHHLRSLQRLKHNSQIFEALLYKQKQITESTEKLGITLANPGGKVHLIKVCNPYCEPCAQAHPIIDELLKNNPGIQMQIIFTATEAAGDFRNKPVKTLLALNQTATGKQMTDALDNWYLQKEKNYEYFEKQYPFEKEVLEAQLPAIKEMHEWCNKMEIKFTPTFFINNHQLPGIYSAADLQYFLSV